MVQVQSEAQAKAAAQAGAAVMAALGTEGGGHTGFVSGTLPLVPAIIEQVGDIPVVAAGGIADGRGLAAVLMLGAAGAWVGTRFVLWGLSRGMGLLRQMSAHLALHRGGRTVSGNEAEVQSFW